MAIEIYRKHLYTSTEYEYLPGYIYEYDITSAGMNILYEAGHLTDEEYNLMCKMNKAQRTVTEGNMIKEHKELAKIKMDGLIRFRKEFMEANNLDDSDILSIKSDAIYVMGKPCYNLEFGRDKLVKFRLDSTFTSFLLVNKVEIYADPFNNKISVKGINNETLKLHDGFFSDFILTVVKKLERTTHKNVIKCLYSFAAKYRNMELPYEYYREFNNDSKFCIKSSAFGDKYSVKYDDIYDDMKENLDISYNYMFILGIIRAII